MNLQGIKLTELNQNEMLIIEGGCAACKAAGALIRDFILSWLVS